MFNPDCTLLSRKGKPTLVFEGRSYILNKTYRPKKGNSLSLFWKCRGCKHGKARSSRMEENDGADFDIIVDEESHTCAADENAVVNAKGRQSVLRAVEEAGITGNAATIYENVRGQLALQHNTSDAYRLGGGIQHFPEFLSLHSAIHRRQAAAYPRLPKSTNELTFPAVYNALRLTNDGDEFLLFVRDFGEQKIICFATDSGPPYTTSKVEFFR